MKLSRLSLLLASLLATGCQSVFDRRVSRHREAWSHLPAEQQQRLRVGQIRAGDTEENVLIALGPPDRKQVRSGVNDDPDVEWIYWDLREDVHSEPGGPPTESIRVDGTTGQIVTTVQPDAVLVAGSKSGESSWVRFRDGVVIACNITGAARFAANPRPAFPHRAQSPHP